MSLVITLNPDSERFEKAGIAELCPSDIMKSEIVTTTLKKRKWSRLVPPEELKRAYFDPAPLPEDTTVAKYHQRILTILPQDRKELHLFLPFEAAMDTLTKMESEMAKMKSDMAEMKAKSDSDKFKLFYGNMLISLARNLAKQYKPAIADDISTTKLQQFVMSIEDKQLRDAGVPTKVWPFLRAINKFVSERNQKAHESAAAFANLLCEMAITNPGILDQWKGCFEFVYGGSVEEMADEGKKDKEDIQMSWDKVMYGSN